MTSVGIFGVLTDIRNAQVTKADRLPSASSMNQSIVRLLFTTSLVTNILFIDVSLFTHILYCFKVYIAQLQQSTAYRKEGGRRCRGTNIGEVVST
jgi:hypothetical protein